MAALALGRAGWRVTVLERAPALEEVGAGIQIPPNASRILKHYGLLERVTRDAIAPETLIMRRARDGAELTRLPLGPIAELRWKTPYLVVHRADLQSALLEAIAREPEITVKTGTSALGFASSEGGVQVGGRMGRANVRFDGDLLVAADGLRSALRGRMGFGAGDAPVYSGRTAWRALVKAESAPAHALRLASNLWLGPQAHLVHYPLRDGRQVNVVAITEDAWRGDEDADFWSVPGDPAHVARRFARWHKDARDVIGAATELRRWPLFDRNPAPRWSVERVVLLGDAAHPVLPFLAQGAALAIEDASALGAAAEVHGADVRRLIGDYEAARIRRAGLVNTASRRQGGIYHLSGVLGVGRDYVLRTLGPERLMERLDWLYLPP
jgi:salicylate hydroxylase